MKQRKQMFIRVTEHALKRFNERFMQVSLSKQRVATRMQQLLQRAHPWGGQRGDHSQIMMAEMYNGPDVFFVVTRSEDGDPIILTSLTKSMALANMKKMKCGIAKKPTTEEDDAVLDLHRRNKQRQQCAQREQRRSDRMRFQKYMRIA